MCLSVDIYDRCVNNKAILKQANKTRRAREGLGDHPEKLILSAVMLFQKGGPLSAVPMVLAGGVALMAVVGIFVFREPASMMRVAGIILSLPGLFLLCYTPIK